MKSTKTELYEIDNIIAKLSKEFDKETTKYKEVLDALIPKLNAKLKEFVNETMKEFTTKTTVSSKLSIDKSKGKDKVKESKKIEILKSLLEKETGKKVTILNENLGQWIKRLYYGFKGLFSTLNSVKKQLLSLSNNIAV